MSQTIPGAFIVPEDAPAWFIENLRHPGRPSFAVANAGEVHFLTWNWQNDALPTLMLVHGFSGHAHWWSFLAPFFSERYRVLAVDLPGMGESAPLSRYTDDCFADALIAIIEQHQLAPVTIVGHSFGGAQSIRAMARRPDLFRQGVVVDSYITLPPEQPARMVEATGKRRYRNSQAECIDKFRLSPPQPLQIEAIRQYIGFHSCARHEQGWYWKFDPWLCNRGEIHDVELTSSVIVPVDCIYGELSMFNCDDRPARILQSFAQPGQLILIPEAFHHLMIDHPLELVDSINAVLF